MNLIDITLQYTILQKSVEWEPIGSMWMDGQTDIHTYIQMITVKLIVMFGTFAQIFELHM
jgi:hypothetical protein